METFFLEKKHIVIVENKSKCIKEIIPWTTRSMKKRDSKRFFSLTIEKKVKSVTRHYETMLEQWWNGPNHLWNITINPDYKTHSQRSDNKTWGELDIKQTFKKLDQVVFRILNNDIFAQYIKKFIIFFELGDKNGKPHCNLCINAFKDTPIKVVHIIIDKLKSYVGRNSYSTNLKDQRKLFSKPDIYNAKDATFMSKSLKVYPKEYTNIIRS